MREALELGYTTNTIFTIENFVRDQPKPMLFI